jgi:hypothetical protein
MLQMGWSAKPDAFAQAHLKVQTVYGTGEYGINFAHSMLYIAISLPKSHLPGPALGQPKVI